MDERITGSFPGGPRRVHEGGPPRAPSLRTVEELERGVARRSLRRVRERRRRRMVLAGLLAAAFSFALGAGLGLATHTSPEDLLEGRSPRGGLDALISTEVNRTLLELWKMEDAEKLRGRIPGR